MSATPRATTPSSRCSATSRSATTSRSARSSLPGTSSPRSSGCRRTGSGSPSIRRRRGARPLEEDRRASGRSASSATRTISGRWAPTGPCGHCSEIFYDQGETVLGGPPGSPEEDGDRFLEFWNLVFMQFEQVDEDDAHRPAEAVDRHRHGAGAHRRDPAGRHQQLRHRSLQDADRAPSTSMSAGRRGGEPGKPARHRRSSARHELPDRRRRAAVERGPRLCASPHHAPRHAPRASSRRRRSRRSSGWCRRWCTRWARPIRSSAAPRG